MKSTIQTGDKLTAAIKKVSSHRPPHLHGCENNFIRPGSVRNPCDCGMDDLINGAVAAQKRVAKLERFVVRLAEGITDCVGAKTLDERCAGEIRSEARSIQARIRREKGGAK